MPLKFDEIFSDYVLRKFMPKSAKKPTDMLNFI